MIDDPMEWAVVPNLLDAVHDPELVFSLVLANLMSRRLWQLAGRLENLPATALPASEVAEIQHFIDHHYEHVSPSIIFERNGALDLESESRRLGASAVKYACASILSSMEGRVKRGLHTADAAALDRFRKRQLPAYGYSTIDEAYACRRLMRGRKHKPLGLTCCIDEAALFAALVLARRITSAERILFLASPAHHTVLARTATDAWWFYGKHNLFSAADWKTLVSESFGGDVQAAFDFQLPNLDRVMTARGSLFFEMAETSMSDQNLAEQVEAIDGYFEGRLAQLDRALLRGFRAVGNAHLTELFAQINEAGDGPGVQQRLRRLAFEENHPAALRALYTFRTLDVPDPDVYLRAARIAALRNHSFPRPASIEQALGRVAAIKGCESIFDDETRIAMPDETVRFDTGSDRDKALLLHVMLKRFYEETGSPHDPIETIITNNDSYVVTPFLCFSLRRMAAVPSAEGSPLYRFGTVSET